MIHYDTFNAQVKKNGSTGNVAGQSLCELDYSQLSEFLTDPSPIIAYWLCLSLTDCRIVNLIDEKMMEVKSLGGAREGSGSGHGCPLDVVVGLLVLQLPHKKNCRCGRNAFDLLPKYSNIALYGAPALQDVQLTS